MNPLANNRLDLSGQPEKYQKYWLTKQHKAEKEQESLEKFVSIIKIAFLVIAALCITIAIVKIVAWSYIEFLEPSLPSIINYFENILSKIKFIQPLIASKAV